LNIKKKSDIQSKLTPDEIGQLEQAREIIETVKTDGWNIIASFIRQSIVYPDPAKFTEVSQVILPYTEAYGASELARKIGIFVGQQESILKHLTEKMDEDAQTPSYNIGD
jgi:hypothetical protein